MATKKLTAKYGTGWEYRDNENSCFILNNFNRGFNERDAELIAPYIVNLCRQKERMPKHILIELNGESFYVAVTMNAVSRPRLNDWSFKKTSKAEKIMNFNPL